jgi:hypothetical protein
MNSTPKTPLNLQLRAAALGTRKVFTRPLYILIAVFSAFLGLGIILWSLNLDALRFILFMGEIPASVKFDFVTGVYQGLFGLIDTMQSLVLITFAVLFGVNISLMIFVVFSRVSNRSAQTKGAGGLALAIIAGGCAACGASLLAPLLTTIGITSLFAIQQLGTVVGILGILLTSWSILQLGKLAATAAAQTEIQASNGKRLPS